MAKGNSSVAVNVRRLLEEQINSLGYEIWDVEYVKEGATWYLRITIDSENGIDINDCEKVHRAIDPVLDEADPIQDAYYLEVSSPGVERVLRTKEHFKACAGQKAQIKLYKALDGRKALVGIIGQCDKDDTVVLIEADNEIEIPMELIAKANTVFEFE